MIPLGTDVPKEHNLSNLLAVLLHVYQNIRIVRLVVFRVSLHDAGRKTRDEAVALPRDLCKLLLDREGIPFRELIADGYGAVGFREAIGVARYEVKIRLPGESRQGQT